MPWLKTLDASVAGGEPGRQAQGRGCVYLEPWHADIEEFLELRDNTGDERQPHPQPQPRELDPRPVHAARRGGRRLEPVRPEGRARPARPLRRGVRARVRGSRGSRASPSKTIKARELYARMMRTLAQTGNGWMTFKDKSQPRLQPDRAARPRRSHLSNLCTEIIEVTSEGETAVCNLGSINLGAPHRPGRRRPRHFDFDEAGAHRAHRRPPARSRDRPELLPDRDDRSARTCSWRPVGLGRDGPAGRLLPDAPAVRRARGARVSRSDRRGDLLPRAHAPRSSWRRRRARTRRSPRPAPRAASCSSRPGASTPSDTAPLGRAARAASCEHGLRNSLLIAIAPTATIASIAGCYECIEPQVSNLFKRETLSGDFLQVNRYLVDELKAPRPVDREHARAPQAGAKARSRAWSSCRKRRARSSAPPGKCPMRSLIDMAADRGAFIDQSQSLNLFVESPNIGQLSSMYFYAWKKGLKTTYYLRSRPATRIAKATVTTSAVEALPMRPSTESNTSTLMPSPARSRTPRAARPASDDYSLGTQSSRPADGLDALRTSWSETSPCMTIWRRDRVKVWHSPRRYAATARNQVNRPARLLDPGLCLTLRPMAYPEFFEMYRAAIKNTWTVEEVDFSTDIARPAQKMTERRAPPDPAPRRLLRDRRLDRREQPRAQPLQAHQRARGAACTCRASSTRRRCTSSST